MHKPKKILFGVLNWGLGHATRSIPIIRQLIDAGFEVVLASDGSALQFLQQTFPGLQAVSLPAYDIQYSQKPYFFSLKILSQFPHILKTLRQERDITHQLVDQYQPDLLITDNRFGFYDARVKNIYITHQLQVLSGITTPITTYLHAKIYKKYDQIWVPDYAGDKNLSGKLGHLKKQSEKVKYIGTLSRMQKKEVVKQYDVLAILSGPEPQRSLLEHKIQTAFEKLSLKTAIVQGVVTNEKKSFIKNGVDIYNYLNQKELEAVVNASEIIISRSGYTSIMELVNLQKKVLWIPTPGQAEQEYLAKYLLEQYGYFYQKQRKLAVDANILNILPPTDIVFDSANSQDVIELINMNFK